MLTVQEINTQPYPRVQFPSHVHGLVGDEFNSHKYLYPLAIMKLHQMGFLDKHIQFEYVFHRWITGKRVIYYHNYRADIVAISEIKKVAIECGAGATPGSVDKERMRQLWKHFDEIYLISYWRRKFHQYQVEIDEREYRRKMGYDVYLAEIECSQPGDGFVIGNMLRRT